jgi:hypothetical protein
LRTKSKLYFVRGFTSCCTENAVRLQQQSFILYREWLLELQFVVYYRLHQGVFYHQNIIQVRGSRGNLILFTSTSKVWISVSDIKFYEHPISGSRSDNMRTDRRTDGWPDEADRLFSRLCEPAKKNTFYFKNYTSVIQREVIVLQIEPNGTCRRVCKGFRQVL